MAISPLENLLLEQKRRGAAEYNRQNSARLGKTMEEQLQNMPAQNNDVPSPDLESLLRQQAKFKNPTMAEVNERIGFEGFPTREKGEAMVGGFLQGGQKIAHPILQQLGPGYEEQSNKWGDLLKEAFGQQQEEHPGMEMIGQSPYAALALRSGKNPVTRALANSPLAKKAMEQFKPETHLAKFGEEFSPEMAERARIAGQTETPLGEIIRSGPMKREFENKLPGVDPILTRLEEEITKRGNALLGEDLGGDPNEVLGKIVKEEYEKANDIKNSFYNPIDEMAKKEGINITLPTASKTARANLKALENSPMLKDDADFSRDIKRLLNVANHTETKPASTTYSSVLDAQGNPIITGHTPAKTTYPSIAEAKNVAQNLYKEGQILKNNANTRSIGKLYSRIAGEIRQDIKDIISKKGSPELQSQFNAAEKNYRESFSHFLDKEVYPFTGGVDDWETIIRQLVKPSKKADKFRGIQRLNKILPKDKQNLLGDAYLQANANDKYGNLNIGNLNQTLTGLGKRQSEHLFSPERQGAIQDYEIFTGMNREALNRLLNPHTGKRGADTTNAIAEAIMSASLGAGGFMSAGTIGAVVTPIARYAYKAVKEALFRKWLTDPEIREAVVRIKESKTK